MISTDIFTLFLYSLSLQYSSLKLSIRPHAVIKLLFLQTILNSKFFFWVNAFRQNFCQATLMHLLWTHAAETTMARLEIIF